MTERLVKGMVRNYKNQDIYNIFFNFVKAYIYIYLKFRNLHTNIFNEKFS